MSDLISRQAVLNELEDDIIFYTHSDRFIDQDPDNEYHKAIRTALRMFKINVKKIPSAEAEGKEV